MKTGSLESRLKIPRPARKSTNHILTRWGKQGRVESAMAGMWGMCLGLEMSTSAQRRGSHAVGPFHVHVIGTNGRCDFTRDREGALFSADRIGHRENVLTDNLSLLFHTRQVGRVVQRNHIYS